MANLVSPLSKESILYTWKELIKRAGTPAGKVEEGVLRVLDIPVFYGLPKTAPASPYIAVCRCKDSSWMELLNMPEGTLAWSRLEESVPKGSQLHLENSIPVLFWGEGYENGNQPFAERRSDGSVIFYADIIAASFFMLSRWEETVVPIRDRHDRFPGIASVAWKQGFLDRPLVDEYAIILREWLKVILPGWQPALNEFKVHLSHDIDHVRLFPDLSSRIVRSASELFKRRDIRSAINAIFWNKSFDADPYYRRIYELAKISLENGLSNDSFYFMSARKSNKDAGYDINSPHIRRCIDSLLEQGFEIGLHPSYYTYSDPVRMADEKARIESVLGFPVRATRQHYLRFKIPKTWRILAEVGFTNDGTLSFADQVGFRCGTCHAFKPFDVINNSELAIEERPLIVMDRTIVDYLSLAPPEGSDLIVKLALRCRSVEGTFTFLWHNTSIYRKYLPWIDIYPALVRKLSAL